MLPAVLLLLAGCGGELIPVTGSVTFGGRPLPSGTVGFHGTSQGTTGYGNVANGRYAAKTGNRFGLKPGLYRVTLMAHGDPPPGGVSEMPTAPPLLTPPKYASPETSPLSFDVRPGRGAFDIAIDGS
jgi:hypothetical protein